VKIIDGKATVTTKSLLCTENRVWLPATVSSTWEVAAQRASILCKAARYTNVEMQARPVSLRLVRGALQGPSIQIDLSRRCLELLPYQTDAGQVQ
jgi:hypothetical protein